MGLSEAFSVCVFPLLPTPGGGQAVVASRGEAQRGRSLDATESYFPPDARDGENEENREMAITRLQQLWPALRHCTMEVMKATHSLRTIE